MTITSATSSVGGATNSVRLSQIQAELRSKPSVTPGTNNEKPSVMPGSTDPDSAVGRFLNKTA